MKLKRLFGTACAALSIGALSLAAPANAAYEDCNIVKCTGPDHEYTGEVFTKDNMAEAGELLIPGIQWYVQQGMEIKVIKTIKIPLPKLFQEATEKYSGQVEISPDGRELFNYVAGVPFPAIDPNDPLAGAKLMWNQEQKPQYVDNVGTEWITELVNSKGELERTYGSQFWRRMMWTGRLYTEPKPVVPNNPPLRYTEQFGPLFIPNDLKGAGVLNNRYLGMDVPDDSYMYLPELRRVRRISVANRSDAFWGTDMDLDSLWGFNSKHSYWTFRLLAEKDILAPVHIGLYGTRNVWCAEPDGTSGTRAFLPCNIPWERRAVYVVEGIPSAYSQYAYSKRIMYIDKDFWGMNFAEMYDQGGELWKFWFNMFNYVSTPYEGYPVNKLEGAAYDYDDVWAFTPHGQGSDLQLAHATKWDAPSGYSRSASEWTQEWYFNEQTPINTPEAFSVNFLIRSAR